MFPRTAEMATKATEYKANRELIDLTARFCKKAIANRIKRAHGEAMHNKRVGLELFAKGIAA
jgi:uncharacterized protein YggU (UPF0235/DUF167 family)